MFRSEAGPLAIPIQRCQLLISGSIVVNIKSFSRNRSLPPPDPWRCAGASGALIPGKQFPPGPQVHHSINLCCERIPQKRLFDAMIRSRVARLTATFVN